MSIEALRWTAMEESQIAAAAVRAHRSQEHTLQLHLALALSCKGSVLVTVKNTEVNNGLEAWRGLKAACDCNNGRQRVRTQYLMQLKRSESIGQTTETVERWGGNGTSAECSARYRLLCEAFGHMMTGMPIAD